MKIERIKIDEIGYPSKKGFVRIVKSDNHFMFDIHFNEKYGITFINQRIGVFGSERENYISFTTDEMVSYRIAMESRNNDR